MSTLYTRYYQTIFLFSLLLFGLILSTDLIGQERTKYHPKIEQYLNPDGTLKRSELPSGTLDAEGWQVETTKDGELRFSPEGTPSPFFGRTSVQGDEYWDDRFGGAPGATGVNDEIFTLATDDSKLYLAGAFTKAGDLEVNNMATWDGEQWGMVGVGPGALNGVNGFVNSMSILYGILYTGGQFTSAGGKDMQNIAAYDIQKKDWQSIGDVTARSGVASVNIVFIDGDNVYIGGTFDKVDQTLADNVAGYNVIAKRWFPLGTGTDGTVNAIAKGVDGIYVGGSFSSAGGVATNSIARWDGSEWHGLAGGVDGFVNAIAVLEDTTIFVGGGFVRAGDTVASNIARWRADTATWTRLTGIFYLTGGPVTRLEENGVDGVVRSLIVRGTDLYVGGTFLTAFPGDYTTTRLNARYIARWNEFKGDPKSTTFWWKGLGQSVNGFVNAMEYFDGGLYAAGSFTRADGQRADGIARWDGLRWRSLATGAGNNIFALDADNGEIWVGGIFNQPGTGQGTRLAKLNGSKWELIPGLFRGNVFNLISHGDWVYVTGRFDGVGSVNAKNIVRWNKVTNNWEKLGSKAAPTGDDGNDFVAAVAFDGDYVYIGGNFTSAGGLTTYSIVRWDSKNDTWDSLGRGINGHVFSIVPHGDEVYVGGRFLGAGNLFDGPAITARNIALWKDGEWSTLEEGVDEVVWAMIEKDNKIYMGGNFDSAGTMAAGRFVAWDVEGKKWEATGSGLYDRFIPSVNSLSTDGRYIYAGGNFTVTEVGGDSVHYIARWDGGRWKNLGSGLDSYVYVVDIDEKKVYVAGAFNEAGGKSSFYFGIYADPLLSVEGEVSQASMTLHPVAPNPFAGGTTIRFETTAYAHVSLRLFDMEGKQVARLIDNDLPAGDHRLMWEPDQATPAGTYMVQLTVGEKTMTQKLIKEE